jgi:hypothetical protein
MIEETITEDERRALRMWFRQAIAQVEQEEVTAAIKAELAGSEVEGKHRYNVMARRRHSRRNRAIPHLREMVF